MVVMELADSQPEEITKGPAPSELPFLNVQRYLRAGGIEVPGIWSHDPRHGLIYLEDLGDRTMESAVAGAGETHRRPYYEAAIEGLARLQEHATARPEGCVAFWRRFDRELLRWELDHFREWLLEAQRGAVLTGPDREALDRAFDAIADELAAAPTAFVHRDYQSRNLMVQGDWPDVRLRLIDFQDALTGPLPYDLVALLRDSYVELSRAEVGRFVERYLVRRRPPIAREAFWRLFHLQTVQRKLKDAGRFVFIERRKNNPSFLPFVAPSLRYARDALLELDDLASLRTLLTRHVAEFGPPPSPTGTP